MQPTVINSMAKTSQTANSGAYKAPRNRAGTNQHTAAPKDIKAFRKAIKDGSTLEQSMVSAGFPKSVAKKGFSRLPSAFQKIVLSERKAKIELARQFSPTELGDYVVGGLITNTINGNDAAVRSYELLGKTKEVNKFTVDSQTGLFIIDMPAHLIARVQPKVIDGNAQQLLPATLPNPYPHPHAINHIHAYCSGLRTHNSDERAKEIASGVPVEPPAEHPGRAGR